MSGFSSGQSVVVTGYDSEWQYHCEECEIRVGHTGVVEFVDREGDVSVKFGDGVRCNFLPAHLEVIDPPEPLTVFPDSDPGDFIAVAPAHETRVTGMTVVPTGKPIFDQLATEITVADECGGEFLVVKQTWRDGKYGVAFDADEWPAIRDAIELMVKGLLV